MAWSRPGEVLQDWYAELVERMYSPSFSVDNDSSSDCTIVKVVRVEARNNQGVLLKVVQALADLNLVIIKANVTSDGEWAMDVFHVTTGDGSKLSECSSISKLEQSLAAATSARIAVPPEKTTTIELICVDRPGLLSEISAVLTDAGCNIIQAKVWTHGNTAAAVVRVSDVATGLAIDQPWRILSIQRLLHRLLQESGGGTAIMAAVSVGSPHPERRLHQIMASSTPPPGSAAEVSLWDLPEKGYTAITIRSPDRPKLFFDALCAITDLGLVVFHATILTLGQNSLQEYFVRDISGRTIGAGEEQRRVARAVAAAVERRAGGVEVKLRGHDRAGLLSVVTRVLRENGLSVRRAEVLTMGGEAEQRFLVSDVAGEEVGGEKMSQIVRRVVAEVGEVAVVTSKMKAKAAPPRLRTAFLLVNLLKVCFPQKLKMIGLHVLTYLS
ncbi:ACT domain-containing protein ACR6-like [Wolffia australiana]